jgi:hypothetical protein
MREFGWILIDDVEWDNNLAEGEAFPPKWRRRLSTSENAGGLINNNGWEEIGTMQWMEKLRNGGKSLREKHIEMEGGKAE